MSPDEGQTLPTGRDLFGLCARVVYPPLFGVGGWVLGVTHLRFRMGMGTWVFTHLPVPRFGFRVWVLGISQHSEFVQNTPNWPFFERYEVIFYVFYYGTYSYVATTTYVRLPISDPSDSSQFRVSGGWHPSPSGEWVGILPTHPPDKTWHPPTIWVAGTRWVDNPVHNPPLCRPSVRYRSVVV